MTLKIISNLTHLAEVKTEKFDIDLYPYPVRSARFSTIFSLFIRSFKYDYILLNGSLHHVLMLAFLKWLVPFNRTKLVVVDILLSSPTKSKDKLKAFVIGLLLQKVHMIILYYKNTDGLQSAYSIAPTKFRYVPFKINQYELIQRTSPTNGGYVFCGGKTRRDFTTLFDAVKDIGLPVRLVTTDNSDIVGHGSFLDDTLAPPNVEIIRLDGSAEKFISYMAASRLVVLPIKPDICGAGIGVYIMAMALKKCVIISAGPGADDILHPNMAIVVPPNDPAALRDAIVRAFNDDDYRTSYEVSGYQYASSLKGEERLLSSIALELYRDVTHAT